VLQELLPNAPEGFFDPEWVKTACQKRVLKENEVPFFALIHRLSALSGLVLESGGKLTITEKGKDVLNDKPIFISLFRAFCKLPKWSLYVNTLLGNLDIGHYYYAYVMYLLSKYGNEDQPPDFYAKKRYDLFLSDEIDNDDFRHVFSELFARSLFGSFLNYFGLVELTISTNDDNYRHIATVKTSEFFQTYIEVVPTDRQKDERAADASNDTPINFYLLRVSLENIQPIIWRKIQVPGNFTLGDLHEVLQVVMGWENAHLHSFTIQGIEYQDTSSIDYIDMWSPECEDENDYDLDDLNLQKGQRLRYTYDFGDDWYHQIIVSKVTPAAEIDAKDKRPLCLGGARACPPEDCGGPWGYAEMLSEDVSFDPEEFNLDAINAELASP
jgi:hypothetical protein